MKFIKVKVTIKTARLSIVLIPVKAMFFYKFEII